MIYAMLQKYFWVLLVAFVLAIGLYNFQTTPGFWFDEGIIAQAAKNIAFEGIYGIQTAPNIFYKNNFWITTGYPLVFPVAFFLKIFGTSVWAARIAPFLYLLFFVAISYFFVKKLYGFKYAALANLLLITFPPLYGNGKVVLGEVPGLFWLVLGGFLYLLYEEKKKNRFLYAAALVWGLSVATKPYFALILPGIAFLILFLRFKRQSINYKNIILFSVFFAIPILAWFIFAFDFTSPQNFSATFSYFLNSYAAQSFEPLKNLFRFVSESTPIHFAALGIVVFAAWFTSIKNKSEMPPITIIFLIFIILAFFWYLKTPGWYRYFFPAHIVVILFFPRALYTVSNNFMGTAVVTVLIAFQAVFMFLNYNNLYGDDVLKLKEYVGENIQKSDSIFVSSLPEAGFILDNKNFYQYIFISENLKIGKEFTSPVPDYLITGRLDDIGRDYYFIREIVHYKVYRKI